MSRINASYDTTLTFQSLAVPEPAYARSIFSHHDLEVRDFRVRQVESLQPDWVAAILIGCFILIAWTQVFYSKRMQLIFRAPFSKRFLNLLTREGNLFTERVTVTLGIVYLLSFSLLLYEFNALILQFSFFRVGGIMLFGALVVINFILLTAKVTLIQMLGAIFKTRETTNNYLLNLLIFALVSGPVFLAFLIFILYLKSVILLQLCLVIYGVIFLFRFLRGFIIGIALSKFSYLLLFVYLCSLEILPLFILIKIVLNLANAAGA